MDTAAILNIVLTANTTQATAALAKTQASLSATEKRAATTGKVMKGAFLGIGVAAGAAVVELAKIGQEFDDAYDTIRETTGATGKEMRKLQNSFRGVVSSVPTDFDTASEAVAAFNQQLGITGKPLTKLSRQAAALAKITGDDVKPTVQGITRLFGDWSVKTDKQSKTLDRLFRLTQDTGIAFNDLTTLLVQFGSPLRQLGFSFNEAAVMFARFQKEGVNMQTAIPGLRMALKNLAVPSDELAKKFKELHIDTTDLHTGLLQVFEAIQAGKIDPDVASQIFGGRAWADLKAAVEEGRFEFEDMIKAMKTGQNTIRGSERSTRDLSEQWKLFVNRLKLEVEPVARDVFKGLSDLMRDVSQAFKKEGVGGVIDLLVEKLNDAVPKIAAVGTKMAAALFKGFLTHPALTAGLGAFLIAKFGGQAAIGAIGTKMGTLIGKRIPGGVVVGILLAAPYLIQQAFKLGEKIGNSMSLPLKKAFTDVFNFIIDRLNDIVDVVNKVSPFKDIGKLDSIPEVFTSQSAVEKAFKAQEIGFTEAKEALKDLGVEYDKSGKILSKWSDDTFGFHAKAARAAINSGGDIEDAQAGIARAAQATGNKVGTTVKTFGNNMDKAGNDTDQLRSKASGNFGAVGNASQQMKAAVTTSTNSMAKAVGQGFKRIETATNKALAAFGVDAVAFAIGEGASSGNGQGHQAGGVIVPGQGSGDKVHAMLEPGEVVLNRTAVSKLGGADRANKINQRIPRFAKGGKASKGTPQWDAMMAMANKFEAANEPYLLGGGHGGFLSSPAPVDCSGFVSAVLHAGGLLEGAPMVSGALASSWGKPGSGPLTVYANAGHTFMSLDDQFYGTSASNPGGGAGLVEGGYDAGYISGFAKKTMDVAAGAIGGVAKQIARQVLDGPPGPLRDIGQGALDKVRGAANKYIASKMPAGTAGGGDAEVGAPIKSLPSALTKYNKQYPEAPSPSHLTAYHMPFNAVAALAEWAGAPGVSMAKTAIGESALAPGASGIDPGGTKGLGIWMITTGFNDSLIKSLGGESAMFNPVLNAQAMNTIFDSQGIGAWYSSTADSSNTHYTGSLLNRQRGGIIEMLANGGVAGKGGGNGHHGHHGPRINTSDQREGPMGSFENLLDVADFAQKYLPLGPGDRHKLVGDARDRITNRTALGVLKEDGSAFIGRMAELDENIAIFADNASRAANMEVVDDDGNVVVPGIFPVGPAGKSEEGWLTDQLNALFDLRNRLVGADDIIGLGPRAIEQLKTQIKRYIRRKINPEITRLNKVIDHLTDRETDLNQDITEAETTWEKSRGKLQARLEKEQGKPKNKPPEKGGQDPDIIARLQHALHAHNTEKEELQGELEAVHARKHGLQGDLADQGLLRDTLRSKLSNTISGRSTAIDTGLETINTRLDAIQGPTGDHKIAAEKPPFGTWGGEYNDVEILLRNIGLDALTAAQDSDVPEAFSLSDLQAFATAIRYGAFASVPGFARGGVVSDFMGAYARGGVALVGERGPELAHMPSGTRVHSARDTEAMLSPVIYADIYIGGEKIAETVKAEIKEDKRKTELRFKARTGPIG